MYYLKTNGTLQNTILSYQTLEMQKGMVTILIRMHISMSQILKRD